MNKARDRRVLLSAETQTKYGNWINFANVKAYQDSKSTLYLYNDKRLVAKLAPGTWTDVDSFGCFFSALRIPGALLKELETTSVITL